VKVKNKSEYGRFGPEYGRFGSEYGKKSRGNLVEEKLSEEINLF